VPPAWLATGADTGAEGDKVLTATSWAGLSVVCWRITMMRGDTVQHRSAMATGDTRWICRPKLPTGG